MTQFINKVLWNFIKKCELYILYAFIVIYAFTNVNFQKNTPG